MSKIYAFTPKRHLAAQENVRAFVDECKISLKSFGADVVFDNDIWDVTDAVKLKGQGSARHRLIFANLETSTTRTAMRTMMQEPFKSFAKALLLYMQAGRPTKHVHARLTALRALDQVLSRVRQSSDPCLLDSDLFNRASQLVSEKYSQGLAHKLGVHLENIGRFLAENQLTHVPVLWKSPLRDSYDNHRIGPEYDQKRKEKMPSLAALEALPKIYTAAKEPKDVVVTSIVALMLSAPDRISEVLSLPVNCEVEQPAKANGEKAYGLRWQAAKGGGPMIKWIPHSMSDIVKDAISRLRILTEEARKIALWYENNPKSMYLREEDAHFRRADVVSMLEIEKIVGLAPKFAYRWCGDNGVIVNRSVRPATAKFSEVEKAVLAKLPRWFPLINPDDPLRFSEALCVVRKNQLGLQYGTSPCMIEPISTNQINIPLGTCIGNRFRSIFERHGFSEPDGAPIRISTHQFRHYLNTLSQYGGLSQLDIAKWSGRKNVSQNKVYDHLSSEQMIEKVRTAIGDSNKLYGPLAVLPAKLPVTRDEFGLLRAPTAHTTDIGFCIHDYTMSPCQLFGDCLHCRDHICVKGDAIKLDRLKKRLEEAKVLLKRAESAVDEGYSGSNRWLNHHRSTVGRLSELEGILEDPSVADGAVVQLGSPINALHGKCKNRLGIVGDEVTSGSE